jgi:hypothetical protein
VEEGLKKHLQQKGIKLPAADALNPDSIHETGFTQTVDSWLRKHIIYVKCLSEFAGGLCTIHASMKRDAHGQINKGKRTAGFLITAAWLSTLLLEQPRGAQILNEPGHTLLPESIRKHIPEKLREDPRGWIARPLAMANNVFNLWGALNPYTGEQTRLRRSREELQNATAPERALMRQGMAPLGPNGHLEVEADRLAKIHQSFGDVQDAQRRQHDYAWNVMSACSFLVAHSLFGISGSKRPMETEDDQRVMNDLILLSANVLATQPETTRVKVIGDTAEYISKLSHVTLDKTQIERAIRDKVDCLGHSTWAARVQTPAQSQHAAL